MSLNISKSGYCRAVQCPKMQWLKKYRSEEFDESVMNQSVLENGHKVGKLAMGLLGEYVEVPFDEELDNMINCTNELIAKGTPIITEASFAYNGLFCSVDILKNLGSNCAEIYEVKSSTSVHDIYYDDAAYQNYVLEKCGFDVKKVCLVHINNQYIRHGEIELDKLFIIEDITEDVKEKFDETEEYIGYIKQYMQQTDEPACPIFVNCFENKKRGIHDCGFFRYCTRDLPKPNVFDIGGMYNKTKLNYYNQGIVSFEDLADVKDINPKYLLQVKHEIHDLPDHIDKNKIKSFMNSLTYPLYFLDFESVNPAIPFYDDSKPYSQIVFQYSLHYIENEGGELKHKEYLAYPDKDPRKKFAEQLCKDIPENACVLVYNSTFEKTRIKELSKLFPDLAERLMNINEHIKDLMVIFRDNSYYTKAMQGSYSIKYVLPALFPDDPDLDYHNLDGVQNGTEASAAFMKMYEIKSAEEMKALRQQLLKYCGLDTFAMVKIWQKLNEI